MSHQKLIVEKVTTVLDHTNPLYDDQLKAALNSAPRIFVSGAGRSGLVARFFAMRLMHGGYEVYIVGEIVTPSIREGDLLIVISGSGETETMIAYAKRAKQVGANIALITAKQKSTVGDMSSLLLVIGEEKDYEQLEYFPSGTIFEMAAIMFLEALISHLIHEKGIPEHEMRKSHANLE